MMITTKKNNNKKQKVDHEPVKAWRRRLARSIKKRVTKLPVFDASEAVPKKPWCTKKTTTCSNCQTTARTRPGHHSTFPRCRLRRKRRKRRRHGPDAEGDSGLCDSSIGDVAGHKDEQKVGVVVVTVPPLPPSPIAREESCPFHTTAVQQIGTSKREWAYIMCPEKMCPYWVGDDEATMVSESVRRQSARGGGRRTMDVFLSQSIACEDHQEPKVDVCGTRLPEFCCQCPPCEFSQWVNQPLTGHVEKVRARLRQLPAIYSISPPPENQWPKPDLQLAAGEPPLPPQMMVVHESCVRNF